MNFSSSTLGAVLEAGKTQLTQQTPDIVLWMLGVFGVTLIIGIVYAAFNRARRQTVAAIGGGSKRRR